jgi:hypothetical protein
MDFFFQFFTTAVTGEEGAQHDEQSGGAQGTSSGCVIA